MPDDDRLTRLETLLEQSHAQLVAVRGIVEGLAMRFTNVEHRLSRLEDASVGHEASLVRLQRSVEAIKDLLDRGNGR
jgi:hypothetical protein